MKYLKVFFSFVFAFCLLVFIVSMILLPINYVWSSVSGINENQKTLLISFIPGLLSIFGLLLVEYLRSKGEIKNQNRRQKELAYNDFLSVVFKYFFKSKNKITDQELENQLVEVSRKLFLYASDDVIKAYSDFRMTAQKDESKLILTKMEKVILAIRGDLGISNAKLKTYDLISLITKMPEKND